MAEDIQSFSEFYPYYLGEHRNGRCRQLHLFGSSMALLVVVLCAMTGNWLMMGGAAIAGYGPAWVGHYVFEKNKPATFRYPLWSFAGDWLMFADIVRGRIPLRGELQSGLLEDMSRS